ncbi:DUF4062 domain-containing protein [Acinetobacter modestus]|uniref:DUF4062 domain-containing protein n=1 Tax=Acinetobacter modestus TaxID=1776740 RepID=UPI001F4BB954|nr:DUF4062 domain-containing protein [Acinetobacter modestus]MCH7388181.1 DUF4062 domain-containing protein [Acinetobacter modestus]
MSQDKKYQVFISSTYTDLIEAREKATKVILDLYHLPVGMEMFSADDDDQWKIITDAIDVSDYYVLIIGHRYGSLTSKGISYTEKEFNYAKSKKIPIISFIRDRNVAVSNSDRETVPESLIKLDKFIEKAKNGKMCAFWTDVSDLERQIAVALPKSFARHKGVGWVRGDTKSEHIAEEIAKLSEENRKLRAENESLKRSVEIRKPNLIAMINGIDGSNNTEVINLKIRELVESERFVKPEKISLGNSYRGIAGTGIRDKSDQIIEFNAEVSKITDDDVIEINKKIQELYQLDQGLTEFIIQIKNNGSSLAKNIDIEIELPEIVKLIDDLTTRNVRKLKRDAANKIVYLPYPDGHNVPDFHDIDVPRPTMPSSIVNRPNTFIKGNMLNITMDSLLHSKSKEFFKFYLCPLVKGDGVIKIKIICEEYLEAVYSEIPITVE